MGNNRLSLLQAAILAAMMMLSGITAQSSITIKVLKGGEAPHMYAYDNSGAILTDDWPGDVFTQKDAEGYWEKAVDDSNGVNIIFNMGSSDNQTGNILRVPGVNGVARFVYDGHSTWFGVMPQFDGNEGYIYFNCPPDWGNDAEHAPYVHFLNSSDGQLGAQGWPGYQMTYAGKDGAGFDVFKYYTADWHGISKLVLNCGSNAHQTGNLVYVPNGYYNTSGSQATVHALTTSNGYSDPGFREGIANQLGISDGSVFVPSTVLYLDVSGQQISSLAGIGNFDNLQTLIASDNSLSTVDLGANPDLEVLDLSGNSSLHGFEQNYNSSPNGFINLATTNNLKELYLANCDIGYFQRINTTYHVTGLERLDLSGNSRMNGWSPGIAAQTGLKYLNVSGNNYPASTAGTSSVLTIPSTFTQLDTLIADDNPNLGNISTLSNASQLRYVSLRNCGLTNIIGFGNNTALEYIDISNNSVTAKNFTLSNNPNLKVFKASNAAIKLDGLKWESDCPLLDTLIVSGNNAMQKLTTLNHATGLKYLDMSGGDLYLQDMPTFVGSNFPSLTYIDFSNDKISAAKTLDGFAALKTLKIGGNTSLPAVTVNNCRALETLDVSGNTALTQVGLTNQGYSDDSTLPTINAENCSHLAALNLSNNAYTAVPATLPFDCSSLYLNSNLLTGVAVPDGSPVQFLYAQDNNFPAQMVLGSTGALVGLDLGNNGFTSFKAENTGLSALKVGDNPQMTTLELHGNANLQVTTAAATMSAGSGLYLLGNTALETIDLSNSSFTGIGQSGSLAGLSAVKTLNGSHNAFTLFSNGTAIPATNNYHYKDPETGQSVTVNISAVPAHANLPNLDDLTGLEWLDMSYNQIDSIHLYKQTGLKYLALQHNGYDRGEDPRTDGKNEQQVYRKGLQKFDAHNLAALEYLNVSDCRIQETAIDRISETTPLHDDGGRPSGGFVWIKHCQNLKEFYADNNGMRSLGIKDNPNLIKVSARYMYGQSPEMMKGSINIHDTGVEGGSVLEYFDVSYSMFDSIGVSVASKLKVLKVDGNPIHYLYLNQNKALEEVYAGGCTLAARNGNTTPSDDGCANTPISGLLQVRAEALPNLAVLNVDDDTELRNLYCEDNPSLPEITGLPDCTDLRVLHAYNDVLLGENVSDGRFDVDANTALTTLWVSNCALPGELRVAQCAGMDTLRCDRNALTKLDVASLAGIHWLDCYNNIGIQELVPAASTNMTHLNLRNCSTIDLDLAANTKLQFMDCDNNKIRELTFADAADIQTISASNNNLFHIDMGSGPHNSLQAIRFENNHINGIDLSQCSSLTADSIKDQGNGRSITANVSRSQSKYLYYFQLDQSTENAGGGNFLNSQMCVEDDESSDDTRTYGRNATSGTQGKSLAQDCVDLTKITWTQEVEGTRRNARADYGTLDPGTIIGDIVVLDNEEGVDSPNGHGTETYRYNNGVSESEFYLNWTANGQVVTGVDDLGSDALTVVGGNGCITVNAPQAMTLTVVDMAGRVVVQRDIEAGQTVIDALAPGIYIAAGQKVAVN